MLNNNEYLLTCLSEECSEVQQRSSKAIRFGLDEVQLGQDKNNALRLYEEVVDLLAVIEMLMEATDVLPPVIDQEMKRRKKEKVLKYMGYSQELGILERPNIYQARVINCADRFSNAA